MVFHGAKAQPADLMRLQKLPHPPCASSSPLQHFGRPSLGSRPSLPRRENSPFDSYSAFHRIQQSQSTALRPLSASPPAHKHLARTRTREEGEHAAEGEDEGAEGEEGLPSVVEGETRSRNCWRARRTSAKGWSSLPRRCKARCWRRGRSEGNCSRSSLHPN